METLKALWDKYLRRHGAFAVKIGVFVSAFAIVAALSAYVTVRISLSGRDVLIPDLTEMSIDEATQLLADARRLSERDHTGLGRAVRAVAGAGAKNTRHLVGGERRRGYWLPPLELARQNWERNLGRSVEWPSDVQTWALEVGLALEHDNVPF